ncbi:MAG TPA: FxsB family cyclophane-forming radical SAM/SPASM peptide maturase [Streptomyces sp.]|nr:FxsB family cyclophane-forming radical SAM/SPASM peptide maturase [Streptomyces sp.]
MSQFVLKVHSRCDLACDHCYIYEHADSSWRGRPRAMPADVIEAAAERIAEHARAHGLSAVHVVLHGGEPLLAGPVRLRKIAEDLDGALAGVCALDLRIHTNGVLLDERFCDLFAELGVKVGVSLDGDRASNDRHRRYADGRSSHPQVMRAVDLLDRPAYRQLFAGLLCTIDIENDPVAVYDALIALRPPRFDFLLPHATWDLPPPRPAGSASPYADWLDVVYERWDGAGRPVPVRLFDSVLRTLHGESSLTEALGLAPADLVVIETDGTFEQADSLKTAYDGAPVTGMDVFTNSLDEVLEHPGMLARRQGIEQLSAQCRSCPVVTSCGGGLYAHRYRTGKGFDNPSVFCADLMALIMNIRAREDAAALRAVERMGSGEAADLEALATGCGSAEVVQRLAEAQLDLNRELLSAVGERALATEKDAAAWELLIELDHDAPDAVDAVLAHPFVRPWALRLLHGAASATDAGGLAEIAVAAALRARRGHRVVVPLRNGMLRLPGLGSVALTGDSDSVEVTGDTEGFIARAPGLAVRIGWDDGVDAPTPHWQPVRLVELPGWTVALEDTDPLRGGWFEQPVTKRLSVSEATRWAEDLAGAWSLIQHQLPVYAAGLAAGLRIVTPLCSPDGRHTGEAARSAFGAVGVSRLDSPHLLALLIIRAFQQAKLGAVLDRHDLCSTPLVGPMQRVYTNLALTDFWRVGRHTGDGKAARRAEKQLARLRQQISDAIRELTGSAGLTTLGERFVAGMASTLERVD